MFTLYSQSLSDEISVHDCDYHKYTDGTELSKGASPDQFNSVHSCIQTCIGDVLIWMNANKLKLNTDKTEVMPVGSESCVALVESKCANTGRNSVPFKKLKVADFSFGVHFLEVSSEEAKCSPSSGSNILEWTEA